MHENEGVRAAIQCLAGVYIYDYVPQPSISKRINELFGMAERRLTALLNAADGLHADQGSELITIAVILSMQDVGFLPPLTLQTSDLMSACRLFSLSVAGKSPRHPGGWKASCTANMPSN